MTKEQVDRYLEYIKKSWSKGLDYYDFVDWLKYEDDKFKG